MVDTLWNVSRFPLFIKCLESLPSLHTLEIRWAEDYITTSLKDALKHSKLPQIKALILPPCAHPLLHHCHSVEDVDCVIKDKPVDFDQFLGFLASIRCSKVRRLAIPLVLGSKAFSRWLGTLRHRRVRTVTNRLQPQDTWLHVQGSLNSPSCTLTQMALNLRLRPPQC